MEVLKRKIIIVGAGHVGSHAGYALLSQGLVEEIVYIDIDQKKAEAQALTCTTPPSTCARVPSFGQGTTPMPRTPSCSSWPQAPCRI